MKSEAMNRLFLPIMLASITSCADQKQALEQCEREQKKIALSRFKEAYQRRIGKRPSEQTELAFIGDWFAEIEIVKQVGGVTMIEAAEKDGAKKEDVTKAANEAFEQTLKQHPCQGGRFDGLF